MAFEGTLTYRGGGSDGGFPPSVVASDAFAPAEGDLILTFIMTSWGSIATVSAWGVQFTEIVPRANIGGDTDYVLYAGIAPPGASAEQVIVAGSEVRTPGAHTIQIAGADTSGTVLDAFAQDPALGDASADSPGVNNLDLPTLAGWSNPDNLALTAGMVEGSGREVVADTNYTRVGEYNSGSASLAFTYFDGEDTSQRVIWTGSAFSRVAGVAMEVKKSGAPAGPAIAPLAMHHQRQQR